MLRFRSTYSGQVNWSRWFGVTFVTAAIAGERSVYCNCVWLTSRMTVAVSGTASIRSSSDPPRFPPTRCSMPARSAIAPTSAVVVDFPLEPVIPTTCPRQSRSASAICETTGMPSSRACITFGWLRRTDCETASRSNPAGSSSSPRTVRSTPSGAAAPAASSSSAVRVSAIVTEAPRASSQRARSRPSIPSE